MWSSAAPAARPRPRSTRRRKRCFHMTAGFLNDPISCLLARLRCLGSIWLSGLWNWSRNRSKQLSEAHKSLPGRSRRSLEATIGGLDPPEAPKIASETTQRAPAWTSVQSLRKSLESPKQRNASKTQLFFPKQAPV